MDLTLDLDLRLTGRVADIDETVLGELEHPTLALIIERGDDLARIVLPASVWPPEKREILAVERPVIVTGDSDVDPFRPDARAVATSLKLLDRYH